MKFQRPNRVPVEPSERHYTYYVTLHVSRNNAHSHERFKVRARCAPEARLVAKREANAKGLEVHGASQLVREGADSIPPTPEAPDHE